ncbi:sodium-dependent transporter [Emcibacter nanhaiensis]|uniref:Transporter n=1 Tax=Emcibacter nanhaiensis TaxID=1505037 RepID=A0A501PMZ0_9PROT|nr:sodium-dependent transporter [Emcibacter nanhaiensis]TPD61447.1 sodium-dependent transporter [Emcibacter nanhaiensis]
MSETTFTHEKWSSRATFLMAAIGAAVGLGNIWRFPFITGENGGGAFVLLYLFFIFAIGLPLIMGELALGKHGKMGALGTLQKLIRENNLHPFWKIIGWFSILVPLLALTYYSVVAGWSMAYIFKAAGGGFSGLDAAGSGGMFNAHLGSFGELTLWHSLYILGIVLVVARGVRSGLETVIKYMMPALFAIVLLLAVYNMTVGNAAQTLNFLFAPDFSKINGGAALLALGQAFFSLAVGVGALITYGAYLPEGVRLPRAASIIAGSDTLVALLAGLAIFPIVFSFNLPAGEGPGLIFVTLPVAFGQMPGGSIVAVLFFLLLTFAAFTSSIAMLEPCIAWLEDKGLSRKKMSWLMGLACWAIGLMMVGSFNQWKDFFPLGFLPFFEGKTIFDVTDFIVANVMLPLNALLMALFVSWFVSSDLMKDQLDIRSDRLFTLWQLLVRFVAPVAITVILIQQFTG